MHQYKTRLILNFQIKPKEMNKTSSNKSGSVIAGRNPRFISELSVKSSRQVISV